MNHKHRFVCSCHKGVLKKPCCLCHNIIQNESYINLDDEEGDSIAVFHTGCLESAVFDCVTMFK